MSEAAPVTADVQIEKLVYGGDGLGRWPGGKAAFVPFTLPGETVRAVRESEKPGFVRARPVEILAPAPERVAPGCEYFLRCGGCQLQHADAEAQLRLKADVLRETLARTGGIAWAGPIAAHASPPWGYRNRVRLRWEPGGLGYFARDSHTLVAVTHCPVASPALNAAIATLAASAPPPAPMEIELAADDADASLLVQLVAARAGAAERALASGLMGRVPGCVSVALAASGDAAPPPAVLAGPGSMRYAVGGQAYRLSHGAFFQVNRFLLEALVAAVTRDAEGVPATGERAADLFSGVGLFALPLAAHFRAVSAVESNPAAAADLGCNAAGFPALRTHAMDAAQFFERWAGPLDLLVADPPRAGLGTKLTAAIAAAAPGRLHYLSCDPATLARDLKALGASGPMEIESIEIFDLFPQTYHIETLVRLRRR